MRRHKSPRELDCFREGGEIVTAALTKQLEAAVRGGTQADAAAGAHFYNTHWLIERPGHRTPREAYLASMEAAAA